MSEPPFFIAGEVLPLSTPSYVTRPADQALSASVLEGAFCYVLTARQMGKSSLMVRTASRLSARGIRVASVDLRTLTPVTSSEWYLELLVRLQSELRLRTDARAWWNAQAGLGAPQRFIDFLHDVALKEVAADVNIALFFDEIDAMLTLDFRDDFFAAIRAMYNARASDAAYKRLTFVLFGVATPTDLIRDLRRTPFNIGRPIKLQEFRYADAAPLYQGLERRYPGQADRILKRIFAWTNGHPYLTQKLCLAVEQMRNVTAWDEGRVDALVAANFFGAAADRDSNLMFVRDKVLGAPTLERQQMLDLYSAVYQGQSIPDDESSPVQNHLELYGLVHVEKGKLEVRNNIYKQVFGQNWIERHAVPRPTPPPEPPAASRNATLLYALLGVFLAIIVGGSAYAYLRGAAAAATATQTAMVAAQATGTAEQSAVAATALRPSPTDSAVEPTTAVPTTSQIDTATPTPTSTPEPPTDTATPTPTSTSEPPTDTATPTPIPTVAPIVARCTVVNSGGVTVRSRPASNSGRVASLEAGTTFQPTAKNTADTRIVWVRVPSPAGWVYAGTDQGLVSCTDLGNVPLG